MVKKRKQQPKQLSSPPSPKKPKTSPSSSSSPIPNNDPDEERFSGSPIPSDKARSTWPHRYLSSTNETAKSTVTFSDGSTEEKDFVQAKCHYEKAVVDGVEYDLDDDAYIQAPEDEPHFIAKIVEMFETVKSETYICTRWFYRAKDTVIKDQHGLIEDRRVFYSDVRDDNPLNSIISKLKINKISPAMDTAEREKAMISGDFYVDMMYSFPHAFTSLNAETGNSSSNDSVNEKNSSDAAKSPRGLEKTKRNILDLYSGCGAMSSGLCIGATLAGENFVTKWAVDFNSHACESLKANHPNTEVRNEDAEDFFDLLKEWQQLCNKFNLLGSKEGDIEPDNKDDDESDIIDDDIVVSSGEYEVEKLIAICFGDPNHKGKRGLHYKVRWKGFGKADDTWEPVDGLSSCQEKIKDFVVRGFRAGILPLPGDVDFMCGGPPCQGISGFNRFRDAVTPLEDKKNHQLIVYMNIVEFLKPKYVLMENVTDILKFAKGLLTSYAVGRLVSMNYQARLGIMAAGAYGVPQCRMRFFLWGAGPTEILPQFPLPTHEVLKKGVVINEFKENIIGLGNEHCKLQKPVLLGDAISDLPEVSNDADLDEMPYDRAPDTVFQKFIRLKRNDIFGYKDAKQSNKPILYDHRPLQLNQDDLERVRLIPKEKGANFRNLPGLIVGPKNVIQLEDPTGKTRPLCTSGQPLVPTYAIKFEDGKSSKPFGRLGMDDIVATVVTRAEPHNQAILHLNQDRVLSVRENARLQGFPDCYRLYGPIKQRYMQVGNAVSFSVSIPLGYCLGKAIQGHNNGKSLSIPFKFPDCLGQLKSVRQESEESTS